MIFLLSLQARVGQVDSRRTTKHPQTFEVGGGSHQRAQMGLLVDQSCCLVFINSITLPSLYVFM